MTDTGKPAPMDLDAEAAVLSSVLLRRESLDEVHGLVHPAEFYSAANGHIYEAALEVDADGEPVDTVTVASRLRTKGRLEQVGGTPYLLQLTEAHPYLVNVVSHAKIVSEKAALRRVAVVCRQKAVETYDRIDDVSEWLQRVEADVFEATRTRDREDTISTMSSLVATEREAMVTRAAQGGAFSGLPTGIRALDKRLNGLKWRNKYTVASRPGMGKSGFALGVAINIAKTGYAVVFISIEMPSVEIAQRAIAQEGGIDSQRIERGVLTPDQWRSAAQAFTVLDKLPIAVDDAGEQTAASIRSSVRRAMAKINRSHPGMRLGMIVIDHLGLVTPVHRQGRSRSDDVAEISWSTRQLAKEFNCVVLELAQLNRECEKRPDKRPLLSDLRDSGGIEQDSFGVLMLYRDDYYRKPNEKHDGVAEVIVRKCRQGGRCGTVETHFKAHTTAFYGIADSEYDEVDEDNN